MRGRTPDVLVCFIAMALVGLAVPRPLPAEKRPQQSGGQTENDKTETDDETRQLKRWVEFYGKEAASYEFFLAGETPTKLRLQRSSLLTYTNPVRTGQQHGAVYVWTNDGRPLVVGSIWSGVRQDDPNKRGISHEFQSLSQSLLFSEHAEQVGRMGVVPAWTPQKGGIQYKSVSDMPVPTKSANSRLLQMRRLSRNFTATILRSNVEGQRSLRLLAQPILRYKSESANILDGALFTFVMGTDPEVILLIEAVETAGSLRWQYAAARFTNRPLRVNYREKEVWSCSNAEAYVGNHPYFLYWGVSIRDAAM